VSVTDENKVPCPGPNLRAGDLKKAVRTESKSIPVMALGGNYGGDSLNVGESTEKESPLHGRVVSFGCHAHAA